ncbi:DUF982 domain-containing protein [Rhizobium sp. Root1220]|uniref:DUF982 domain-containing protein n=1 Tax=Rhizobium sp. Root1220 TaxID=1736432 RepID=UPI0006F9372F|nr:hypothetical protein ASC90_02190 [Rhizobium sp. Root1220]
MLPLFIKPIDVEIDGVGLHAETVQDLTAMLVNNRWPVGSGKKFQIALMRSMKAVELSVGAQTARNAFLNAAREAGVRILRG